MPGGARSGPIKLDSGGGAGEVTRLDVADAVVKCLGEARATNKVFYVGRGDGEGAEIEIRD